MKYEFTGETKLYLGITLKRIRATAAIEKFNVAVGDLGGWIEDEKNLAQSGDAWVSGNAQVSCDAEVYGNAQVYGDAWVSGDARVCGNARVFGNALVSGDAWVSGDANVSGNAEVYGDKIEKENDLINITSNAGSYNITITQNHIKIGCQYHSKTAWFKITENKIRKMDGQKAVDWWKTWKPILISICDGLKQ